jgi:hypothetical protein
MIIFCWWVFPEITDLFLLNPENKKQKSIASFVDGFLTETLIAGLLNNNFLRAFFVGFIIIFTGF